VTDADFIAWNVVIILFRKLSDVFQNVQILQEVASAIRQHHRHLWPTSSWPADARRRQFTF